MSFVKKIWKDRISQFPNRRTINDGYVTKQVTVGRDEGAVTEEGTPFDATEMNDLENRIYAAIEEGGGGGGSAGTYNYNELFNKPRINNHELNGNKSLSDLGIASNANELPIESGSATNTKDYIDSGLSGKLNTTDIHYYYFIGTTTANKNLVLNSTVAPNYDPTKEVIVAVSARFANASGMVICTPFATIDNELGQFTCLKVVPATEGVNTANVIIDGYFWTIPRGIRNNS